MENNDLKIVPTLEIVRFGSNDVVKSSNGWSLDENELPMGPLVN